MAKATEAIYECAVTCTFNVPLPNGETYNQIYRSVQETENLDESSVAVPKGTVVPKHFIPKNDQAKKDRADQIECPEKYIDTKEHLVMLAELFVKEGMFDSLKAAKDAIKQQAKDIGVDSEKLGEGNAEETRRIGAIEELLSRGSDDKERRKVLSKILKDGGCKFFAGAPPRNLAQMIYDNDLYEAPSK